MNASGAIDRGGNGLQETMTRATACRGQSAACPPSMRSVKFKRAAASAKPGSPQKVTIAPQASGAGQTIPNQSLPTAAVPSHSTLNVDVPFLLKTLAPQSTLVALRWQSVTCPSA